VEPLVIIAVVLIVVVFRSLSGQRLASEPIRTEAESSR
jgi:hypothetical protein